MLSTGCILLAPQARHHRLRDVSEALVLDTLAENLSVFMMVGVIIVVGLSQINRRIGAILGVVFWSLVAVVGHHAYGRGGAIGILGIKFSEGTFYGLCAALAAINVVAALAAKPKA